MWACRGDSPSDDYDEHNTDSTLLLSFVDALVAPVAVDLPELNELMAALSCRFALDIVTVAQQDRPHLEPDLLAHDPGRDLRL